MDFKESMLTILVEREGKEKERRERGKERVGFWGVAIAFVYN